MPGCHETAFLTVEGDVAHFFLGTDYMGGGDKGSHAAGIVVGTWRPLNRIVVCPDQDSGSPGVADDHVTCLIQLDAKLTGLCAREQFDDGLTDGLVFGCPCGTWDADPFDNLPQIIRGDGSEETADRLGNRLRFWLGSDKLHCDNHSSMSVLSVAGGSSSVYLTLLRKVESQLEEKSYDNCHPDPAAERDEKSRTVTPTTPSKIDGRLRQVPGDDRHSRQNHQQV